MIACTIVNVAANFLNFFRNFIFPPRCFICTKYIGHADDNAICANCWHDLEFITKPYCGKCGVSLRKFAIYSAANTNLNLDVECDTKYRCHKCRIDEARGRKKYYVQIRSALLYTSIAKNLVKKFKYHKDLNLQNIFCNLLSRPLEEIIANELKIAKPHNGHKGDLYKKSKYIITPVPLHKQRLKERGYNQSALLAKKLAKIYDMEYVPDLLIRKTNNKSQSQMNGKARLLNVRNIFSFNSQYNLIPKYEAIFLIDDVITTGATVNECCKILARHNKADRIYAISIART